MGKSSRGLLAQIEDGALDSQTPLADVLRKCVALGGRAGSTELRDWARRELDGYRSASDTLPTYRTVPAAICVDGADLAKMVSGQQLSSYQLPEFARDTIVPEAPLPYGVAELEQLATSKNPLQLQHPAMPDLVLYMNAKADYGTAIHSMYWKISATSVHGVLDTIRAMLVSLVAEMRAVGVDDAEIPSAAAAGQAVNVVLHNAKRSTINVTTAQSAGKGAATTHGPASVTTEGSTSRIPAWIRGPWALLLGVSTIAGGGAVLATWQGCGPF
jgi:AbiTii